MCNNTFWTEKPKLWVASEAPFAASAAEHWITPSLLTVSTPRSIYPSSTAATDVYVAYFCPLGRPLIQNTFERRLVCIDTPRPGPAPRPPYTLATSYLHNGFLLSNPSQSGR